MTTKIKPSHAPSPTAAEIRAHFPGLAAPTVLLDNAGGSQLPEQAIDAATRYMRRSFVQLGAHYPESLAASATVAEARDFTRLLLNAGAGGAQGYVIFGPSTSALVRTAAEGIAASGPRDGRDEIIVSEANHESNAGAWARLADRGFTVRMWPVEPGERGLNLDALGNLLGDRTRLVAFPQVSNLWGGIEPVRRACDMIRDAGGESCVDGVAYCPHRLPDVEAIGCDWYAFSTYKVYGPHMAVMFGSRRAMSGLPGPNHYFVPAEDVEYRFELGGVNHEGCAAWTGTRDYLAWLGGGFGGPVDRATLARAFDAMQAMELPLQERLIDFLKSRPRVRIIGPESTGPERVSTISFVAGGVSSESIARNANAAGLGIRFGHFYSHRLCKALGLNPSDGVTRVSLVHYNTMEEVDRLIAHLEPVL